MQSVVPRKTVDDTAERMVCAMQSDVPTAPQFPLWRQAAELAHNAGVTVLIYPEDMTRPIQDAGMMIVHNHGITEDDLTWALGLITKSGRK